MRPVRTTTAVAIVCAFVINSDAAETPRVPALRIETGMHISAIRTIAVDPSELYVITGSEDKTIRVWELASGTLLRTIDTYSGAGPEGSVFSVAVSPDGRTIAAAVWSGPPDTDPAIQLFDRATGRMIRRIGGLPTNVEKLAYSRDSKWLVACLNRGIRLFSTKTWIVEGADDDYDAPSLGAAFSRGDQLVTVAYDGFFRLYRLPTADSPLRLISKRKSEAQKPATVAFSPDDTTIAVGFDDRYRVEVISAVDLSHLFDADTSGVSANLASVAWSSDGKRLYAGGDARRSLRDSVFIRTWSERGRGAYSDVMVADNTIYEIVPLAKGGLLFGTGEPSWGVLSPANELSVRVRSQIADYRNCILLVSKDGSRVDFAFDWEARMRARFSVADRRLQIDAEKDDALHGPRRSADGLVLNNWKDRPDPTINGEPLRLNDVARSIAVTEDGAAALVGSQWYVSLFDQLGMLRWTKPTASNAWSVNISRDGRLAIVAYGDGTIRWHRMSDGNELLTLFVPRDGKRWVVWTPSGYYDTSPGAEDLVGWHVNNGREAAADFFPLSKFRSAYYRPDVIAGVLTTLDESKALELANMERPAAGSATDLAKLLPPVVTITSPENGASVSSAEVTVRFDIRTPSGAPVTRVRALVDGSPVRETRGMQAVSSSGEGAAMRSVTIAMPPHDSEIAIIAENRLTSSVPAIVHLKWTGKATAEFVVAPKLYVLAVGLTQYLDRRLNLKFAAKDAQDFAAAMQRQSGGLYREVIAKVLTDEHATRDEVVDGLDWITKQATSRDIAAVFLAGHGVNDQNGQYYFLPYNADTEKLKRTGVSFADIASTIDALAGKKLFFVDSCHSGNVMGQRRAAPDVNGFINELMSAGDGAVVFAASTSNQYSLEDAAWGNGAFTKALVEGLEGGADYRGSGKISINMIDVYISERVKELTGGRQTPTTAKPQTISDFPIALVQKRRKVSQ